MIFGPYPVNSLVTVMTKERVRKQNLACSRGEEDEEAILSQETSYLRRRLSVATVNCFGHRLVSRISQVGRGALAAAGRRKGWSREEESARLDREASWLEKITGQAVIRRGRFWT